MVSANMLGEVIHALSRLEAMATPQLTEKLSQELRSTAPAGRLESSRGRFAQAMAFCRAGAAILATFCPSSALGQSDETERTRAIELFRESQASYGAGRFREAAVYLEEAYRLDPDPILLYNLARARESGGDLELALDAYQRYLAEAPAADDRPAVKARIAALERQVEERERLEALLERERQAREAAVQEAEAARAAARASQGWYREPFPWILGGVGVAGVAAGVVFGVASGDRRDSARDAAEAARANELEDEANRLALGAHLAYAAGGALTVAGLVWGLVAASSAPSQASPISPSGRASVSLGPRGLQIQGSF